MARNNRVFPSFRSREDNLISAAEFMAHRGSTLNIWIFRGRSTCYVERAFNVKYIYVSMKAAILKMTVFVLLWTLLGIYDAIRLIES